MSEQSAARPKRLSYLTDVNGTLLCFSHLRWDFVFQRPQHLMCRFARDRQVLYWEEPIYGADTPQLLTRRCERTGVVVLTPQLPVGLASSDEDSALKQLLDEAVLSCGDARILRWYYTPMMLPFSQHLAAQCVVYDCMDELANFKGAPANLLPLEQRLFESADLVLTGGHSLFEAKRGRHRNVHAFPSSVDAVHFAAARFDGAVPPDQACIKSPRLGFCGVVDERMDLDLLVAVADARPEWSLVVVGPVIKISEADLPRRPNLHYLGAKSYAMLPEYLRGWDVALMPFAINDATRFISPTKTPEYLAAGCPVVSTAISDVVRHYGRLEAVKIAGTPIEFVAACEEALRLAPDDGWLGPVDAVLAMSSWDDTFQAIAKRVDDVVSERRYEQPIVSPVVWPAQRSKDYDVMVVGAGFAGAVMAERLANDAGKRVLVIDRRAHVAGNAFDRLDDAGLLIHQYGPHIFHTNSQHVVAYLSRFTQWRPYEHRVLAAVGDMLVPMPINRTTLNMLYGLDLSTDDQAAEFLAARAEPVPIIRTSADAVISAVGRELYETFFQGYTRKQWGMDPSELDKSVTSRVPTRTDTDDRYFTDTFQAMPAAGYTKMFERMLDHPKIDLLLGVDFDQARDAYPHDHLVFTGPIDEYFDHCYGKLPYRSLSFRHETLGVEQHQPVAVINYPSEDIPYTRVTEYKHLTRDVSGQTSLTYEYPSDVGDPYYPIPRPENQALFKRYEALAVAQPDVSFVGRLATYRYYNMDQVVGQALSTYRRLADRWAVARSSAKPAGATQGYAA
jgi:UDP-galactopyranose mutase